MELNFHRIPEAEMLAASEQFYQQIKLRRTVRDFSGDAVDMSVIDQCILAAGTAPNGANLQPWHFSVITSKAIKDDIRQAAEQEEQAFYSGRAPEDWLDALKHLGTDAHKPHLTEAPILIAIFQKSTITNEEGKEQKCYYPKESVGIATGMLITALHQAGLATLTHTPSPMKFLNETLSRPVNEKPFLLLVVGYPKAGCEVPDITKLPLEAIRSIH